MNYSLNEKERFETKLTLLQDILDKKHGALVAVLNISENQETLYLSTSSDERNAFLLEMSKEKQKQIDDVLACDEVFQSIFDSIADEFEEESAKHEEKIRHLQFSINEVLDLDMKIRAQEERIETIASDFSESASYILNKQRAASKLAVH
ncbi:MAG: hypothetical protein FWC76_00065 [Defluviitaleaceae bacterium]|nr:hypothetical protein [Defluviitaleaceae bacterium]